MFAPSWVPMWAQVLVWLINYLGFPIFVALYLLTRHDRLLSNIATHEAEERILLERIERNTNQR